MSSRFLLRLALTLLVFTSTAHSKVGSECNDTFSNSTPANEMTNAGHIEGYEPFSVAKFESLSTEFYIALFHTLPTRNYRSWSTAFLSSKEKYALQLFARILASIELRHQLSLKVKVVPSFADFERGLNHRWRAERAFYYRPMRLFSEFTNNIAFDLVLASKNVPDFHSELETIERTAREMNFRDLTPLADWIIDLSRGGTTFQELFHLRLQRLAVENQYLEWLGGRLAIKSSFVPIQGTSSLAQLLRQDLIEWKPFKVWTDDLQSSQDVEPLHIGQFIERHLKLYSPLILDAHLQIPGTDISLVTRFKLNRLAEDSPKDFDMRVLNRQLGPTIKVTN